MEIIRATGEHIDDIYDITQRVIKESYSHYYPASVVDFIASFHHKERIKEDMKKGHILLLKSHQGNFAATGTAREEEISRVFVLPEHQGQGMGTLLMNELEKIVFEQHDKIQLDASLSAKKMYAKRGYVEIGYEVQPIGNGDFVCYSVMQQMKPIPAEQK